MRRREFIYVLGGVAAWPLASYAQQRSENIARIGFLTRKTDASVASQIDAFQQGLHDLGWVEGKNIGIEYRDAGGQVDRHPLKPLNKQLEPSRLLLRSRPIRWELGWSRVLATLVATPLDYRSLPQRQIRKLWKF